MLRDRGPVISPFTSPHNVKLCQERALEGYWREKGFAFRPQGAPLGQLLRCTRLLHVSLPQSRQLPPVPLGQLRGAPREAPAWEQLSWHSLDGFAVRPEVWQLPADRSPRFRQKPDFRAFHQPSISRISLPSSEPPPFPRRPGSQVWRCGFLKLCLSPARSRCA